jgi:hypothetical protein
VCFGGRLMRGNRTRKVDSSKYQVLLGWNTAPCRLLPAVLLLLACLHDCIKL